MIGRKLVNFAVGGDDDDNVIMSKPYKCGDVSDANDSLKNPCTPALNPLDSSIVYSHICAPKLSHAIVQTLIKCTFTNCFKSWWQII